MNIHSRLGVLASSVALATTGVLAAAGSPAMAEQACSAGITCIYAGGVGHDGGSYEVQLGTRSPGATLANISEGNRNRLSSWKNRSSTGARFYYKLDGNGTCVSMRANAQASASASNPDDNEAESHAYNRAC